MRMTIGKKLTLGFGGVLVFVFAATIFSVLTYIKTVKDYEVFTDTRVHQMDLVRKLEVEFKKEVQEWKNILLRGHDPENLKKYKRLFEEQVAIHGRIVRELQTGPYRLISQENQQMLQKFVEAHDRLDEAYQKALSVFVSNAGGNYEEADAIVAGVDRGPTEVLDKLSKSSLVLTQELMKDQARQAYQLGVTLIAVASILFVLGILLTFFTIRSITEPLKSLMAVTDQVADADLTREIKVKTNDELGDLAASFTKMISGLRTILLKVVESTGQITSSSTEILAASQQQAAAAREQSSAVTETTAAAKELSTTSESVGDSIKKVAQVAAHAMAGMGKIKESIDKTNGMLNSLGEKSQKIGKITELIDDVADQTNLLAVNASIEAARAGEQGRGFTVVADEIRKLADSTAKSTKDITALIELIQHEMSNAIMSMETSIQSVDEEARLAQQTTEKSKEISMSTHQQISGAKQIADAMMNIDETMKQVATGAQQSQVAVKQLTGLAGELKQLAGKFKL